MAKLKQYFPYLLLFVLVGIAFFQVSLFIHPLKYDTIDCFYPWRFHIGECLQNGQLPIWNPYQDLGYPIHADPSSGAWYPIVWIIGYFNGYSVYAISIEFLFHVFLAGVGFYMLCKTLKFATTFALIAAIAYMLSGFFIGNAQHLTYIISACWLPFILNFYFRLMDEKSYLNCLKAAFFLFLMITGGYPAITIILFYLLLTFFIIHVIKLYRAKLKRDLLSFINRNFQFFIYSVIFSLVMLVAIYQVTPYLSRVGDFELRHALHSPFSPQSFISFFTPLASITRSDLFLNYPSMRNGYFGICILLFFILGFFVKKPLQIKVLFFFGLFSLTAAVGEYLPVREFLYRYVPMMNVFRFPSVFRLFFIFGAILTGIFYLQTVFKNKEWKVKPLIVGVISLGLIFLIVIIVSLSNGYFSIGKFMKNDLFQETRTTTLWENITFNSIVQLVVLAALFLLLWKLKNRRKLLFAIVTLCIVDLVISVQLNAQYTIYNERIIVSDIAENVKQLPKGFPPQKNISIEEGGKLPGLGQPFWQNLNTFQKQISAKGFNSFSFTSYEFLESEYPQLFNEITKNKILLLSDSVYNEKDLAKYKKDSLFNSNQLFFGEADFLYLKERDFRSSINDTAYLKSYDASNFSITCNVKHERLLTLFQKEYLGWNAYINGEKVPIFKSNLNFMTVIVPPGKSEIIFKYENPELKIAFYISSGFILLAIFLILFDFFWARRKVAMLHPN